MHRMDTNLKLAWSAEEKLKQKLELIKLERKTLNQLHLTLEVSDELNPGKMESTEGWN